MSEARRHRTARPASQPRRRPPAETQCRPPRHATPSRPCWPPGRHGRPGRRGRRSRQASGLRAALPRSGPRATEDLTRQERPSRFAARWTPAPAGPGRWPAGRAATSRLSRSRVAHVHGGSLGLRPSLDRSSRRGGPEIPGRPGRARRWPDTQAPERRWISQRRSSSRGRGAGNRLGKRYPPPPFNREGTALQRAPRRGRTWLTPTSASPAI
jgi:hypothetical protein